MTYSVVDAEYAHVIGLRNRLRPLDRRECMGQGVTLRRMMRDTFRRSLLAKTFMLDGVPIAMCGMGGSLIGDEGHPWLLTAPEVERFPVAVVKEARYAIAEMASIKPYLWNYVLSDYSQAVKLVSMLGFSVDQPKWTSPSGDIYRRFWMKR